MHSPSTCEPPCVPGDGRGGEGRVPPKRGGLEGGELVLFSIIDPLCGGTALPPRPWPASGTASDGRVLGERGRDGRLYGRWEMTAFGERLAERSNNRGLATFGAQDAACDCLCGVQGFCLRETHVFLIPKLQKKQQRANTLIPF